MDTFPRRASFPGPCIDVKASAATFVGQSCFDGCIAFCNWRRSDVAALLPAELELAASSDAAADGHPVAFIFGEQTQGARIFAGMTFPLGVHYHEFAMAIPFVKHRHGQYLHVYIPRMYAGYFPAVWHGNVHFGLGKQMATLQWQPPLFLVTTERGAPLFHAAVEPTGSWCPGADGALTNFEDVRQIFMLPIVGRRANGSYVCSYFGWDFETAVVRAADSWVSIDAPFIDGLAPRQHYDVRHGTFEVRGMRWRLSWPTSCRF